MFARVVIIATNKFSMTIHISFTKLANLFFSSHLLTEIWRIVTHWLPIERPGLRNIAKVVVMIHLSLRPG